LNSHRIASRTYILLIAISVAILALPQPLYATNITLAPTSGIAGSRIAISGDGFIGKLATIYWDGKKLIQDVPVSKAGQINYTFEIPPAPKGEHVVKVSDDSNWANIVATSTFFVTPSITAEPPWGKLSNVITIFGYGFAPNESTIKTTFDGKPLSRSPISADRTGSWHDMFTVPYIAKGEYAIQASGELTKPSEIAEIVFTVAPYCKAKPLSGPVGIKVTITGVGFRAGEDGITFTWDGPIIDTNFVAQPNGSFSYSITVPPSVKGRHIIGIYGSSFTPKGIVPDIEFEVTPSIQLTPSSLINSREVEIKGTGFNAGEAISISVNQTNTNVTAKTDNYGNFSAVFQVPPGSGKDLTVTATGNKGAGAQATFTSTKVAPQAPQLLSPVPGVKIQAFNSVADVIVSIFRYIGGLFDFITGSKQTTNDSALTTMNWSASSEQPGLKYTLQISKTEDFTSPAFHKEGIKNNNYILKQSSLPMTGIYYWRVKAVDDIGDESQWSNTWKFEIVPTSPLVFALSVTIIILVLALIFFGIMALINRNRYR